MYFHKVFLTAGGYAAEYDTAADPHYDASGLGRIHRKNAPSALALSVPFAKEPAYTLPAPNPGPLAISPGAVTPEGCRFGSDTAAVWECTAARSLPDAAEAAFRVTLPGGAAVTHTCRPDAGGVTLTAESPGETLFELPVFVSDGANDTVLSAAPGAVTVTCRGWTVRWTTDGTFTDTGAAYVNRNGTYRRFLARGAGRVTLHARIVPEN